MFFCQIQNVLRQGFIADEVVDVLHAGEGKRQHSADFGAVHQNNDRARLFDKQTTERSLRFKTAGEAALYRKAGCGHESHVNVDLG